MTIPEHVNFTQFYIEAKKKNIRITSRFEGVTIYNHNQPNQTKLLQWRAQRSVKGRTIHIGYFSFDKQGEIQASKAYIRFCKQNDIQHADIHN